MRHPCAPGRIRRLRNSEEGRLDDLTPQERRIFDYIGEGRTNRQIASEMYLAEKTVKNYVSNMGRRLRIVSTHGSRRTRRPRLVERSHHDD